MSDEERAPIKIKEVTVTFSRTVQMSQYHPITASVSLTADLHDNDIYLAERRRKGLVTELDLMHRTAANEVNRQLAQFINDYSNPSESE